MPKNPDPKELLKDNNVRTYIAYLKKVQRFAASNKEKQQTGFVNIAKDANINIHDSNAVDEYIVKEIIRLGQVENVKNRSWKEADASLNKRWEGLPGGSKHKNPNIEKITTQRSQLLNDQKNNILSSKPTTALGKSIEAKATFEKRLADPSKHIKNADGTTSTHKMMSFEADGNFYAAPTIVELNGKLVELSEKEAIDFAFKNKELKQFKTQKEAQDYASGGYKKNKKRLEQAREELKKSVDARANVYALRKDYPDLSPEERLLVYKDNYNIIADKGKLNEVKAYKEKESKLQAEKKGASDEIERLAQIEKQKEGDARAKRFEETDKKPTSYELAKKYIDRFDKGSVEYKRLDYLIRKHEGKRSSTERMAITESFNTSEAEGILKKITKDETKYFAEKDANKKARERSSKATSAAGKKISNAATTQTSPAEVYKAAKNYVDSGGAANNKSVLGTQFDLQNKKGWDQESVSKFSELVTKMQGGEDVPAPAGVPATTKTGTGTGSGKKAAPANTLAPKGTVTTTVPPKAAQIPPTDPQVPSTEKTEDLKGNDGSLDDDKKAAGEGSTTKPSRFGLSEKLGAMQMGIGLAGANKYSKLTDSLIKDFPTDTIPLEARRAYEDSQTAKAAAHQRAFQGMSASQKASLQAEIEGTAAADLSTASNPLSRSLAVRNKFQALLGMSGLDEEIRGRNEEKYLNYLTHANDQAKNISTHKRMLYEDRRKQWELQYERSLMGEKAGATLLHAGLTNLATGLQVKELEAMKKPAVTNIYTGTT